MFPRWFFWRVLLQAVVVGGICCLKWGEHDAGFPMTYASFLTHLFTTMVLFKPTHLLDTTSWVCLLAVFPSLNEVCQYCDPWRVESVIAASAFGLYSAMSFLGRRRAKASVSVDYE